MSSNNNQAIYTALKLLGIVEIKMDMPQYGSKALVHESIAKQSRCEVQFIYALKSDHEASYRINTFIPPSNDNINEIFELISRLKFDENNPF